MSYRISGLEPRQFQHLRDLPTSELAVLGVRRVTADRDPGFPDRITLRDAVPGESLLLLNFTHQSANNAYRSSHAIFILEHASQAFDEFDCVPPALRIRMLSLRAFDAQHDMVDATLTPGAELAGHIEHMFGNPQISYLHAHYAVRGCFAARIDRRASSVA